MHLLRYIKSESNDEKSSSSLLMFKDTISDESTIMQSDSTYNVADPAIFNSDKRLTTKVLDIPITDESSIGSNTASSGNNKYTTGTCTPRNSDHGLIRNSDIELNTEIIK